MATVVIKSSPNGPNVVVVEGKPVTALCRCGHSTNKPYCDGTHMKVKFVAPAAEVKIA